MQLTEEQKQAIEQQKAQCPFCQIVAGKIPAKKVYEDDLILIVLDINPVTPGHMLVLPKEHYPIMPLIPPDVLTYLFKHVRQITKYSRDAFITPTSTTFIANGQAAGQQVNHFLLHVVPSSSILGTFTLQDKELDKDQVSQVAGMLKSRLPAFMAERTKLFPKEEQKPTPNVPDGVPSDLAQMIQENPGFREMIIRKPGAVIEGLKDNPSLQPLFEGVDVFELSKRLKSVFAESTLPSNIEDMPVTPSTIPETSNEQPVQEIPEKPEQIEKPIPAPEVQSKPQTETPTQETPTQYDTPRAVDLSDSQLVDFLQEKEKLRSLLIDDIETLHAALAQQPKLQHFFSESSPEQVRDRFEKALQKPESRLPEQDTSSLDDLAGGRL